MLQIPEEFFKEEVRWDFPVSEAMKRAWAIQLTVLDEVLTIAKKHNIRLWFEYGSLIGVVRHHGYVPWDDDIDLCIMRADYKKFLDILVKELPPTRSVSSIYHDEKHDQPKAFIGCRKYIDVGIDEEEIAITKRLYNCPYSGGVDIFPLDYIPADQQFWSTLITLYNAAFNIAVNYDKFVSTGALEENLQPLEEALNMSFDRSGNVQHQLLMALDGLSSMTTREEAAYVTWYPEYAMCGDRRKRSLGAYEETLWQDFEMMKVPVPVGFDEVLRSEYGENYMTPVRGTAGHGYPFFKEQDIKILCNNKIGQLGDIF